MLYGSQLVHNGNAPSAPQPTFQSAAQAVVTPVAALSPHLLGLLHEEEFAD